jgi:transposase
MNPTNPKNPTNPTNHSTRKNKYSRRARISEEKFRAVVRHFSLDIEAKKTAVLTGLNRNTVNRYFILLRQIIARHCEARRAAEGGGSDNPVAVDPVSDGNGLYTFGITCTKGWVGTELVPVARYASAKAVLRDKSRLVDCVGFERHDGLADLADGVFCRLRQNDCGRELSVKPDKTAELLWGFVKNRLQKFNGIARTTFYLHLKECEFRFNYRKEDLYQMLLKMVREAPVG